MLRLDADGLRAFLAAEFPQAVDTGMQIEAVDMHGVRLSWTVGEAHLRPGRTVSGPTLMTLVDTAAYLVVLSRLGPVALAVTTNLEMHFLRRPSPGALTATARPLKLGRRRVVVQAEVQADVGGGRDVVAAATVTYALP